MNRKPRRWSARWAAERRPPASCAIHRLYTVCERRKRAAEALAYNGLVQSWPEISRFAVAGSTEQGGLFGDDAGDVGEEA